MESRFYLAVAKHPPFRLNWSSICPGGSTGRRRMNPILEHQDLREQTRVVAVL
jgi:hypothetical protein